MSEDPDNLMRRQKPRRGDLPIRQHWNLKKILSYLTYRIFAKHLPESESLGPIGRYSEKIRSIICRPLFMESAKIITISRGVDFDNGCNLIVKDHAHIGAYALIGGNYATVTIGRHVMMGKHCILICQNHKQKGEWFDGMEGKDIIIDDYAWIGHRVTILPGVRIGKRAIVGAGAVVSKDVPDYAIAVGNPAVVKKFRSKD